ncbi:hypothetical protein RP726_13095 [Candidatus Methylospira mobilis]|uniref:hypothetical protein n=1 Tax=Candidatus Methylospira mobilis TaxID=1808979 RepID=UPI0028ECD56D|nr:hypothetical protein [Candidatus Methylospira mobilis]WNV03389.1 hypothetical protein RP726_13095 [Candidatus Methylospira mobilis]
MKISYSTMSRAYSDFRPSIGVNGRAVDDLQIKRLRDMKEGLQHLQTMPSANLISRQASMDRLGWLRQLLDALKMMLLHASPKQAKALALELKSIAGELASIAKGLGAGSSGQAVPIETKMVDVPPNGQASVQSTTEDSRPEATVAEPHSTKTVEAVGNGSDAAPVNQDERKSNSPVGTAGESSRKNSGENSPPQEVDDAVLRGLLLDVKKLLKEVVDMLKSKLAAAGKKTKEDMRAIEKSMSELDSILQQGAASNSYSAQGGLVLGFGSLTVSGLNINLTA